MLQKHPKRRKVVGKAARVLASKSCQSLRSPFTASSLSRRPPWYLIRLSMTAVWKSKKYQMVKSIKRWKLSQTKWNGYCPPHLGVLLLNLLPGLGLKITIVQKIIWWRGLRGGSSIIITTIDHSGDLVVKVALVLLCGGVQDAEHPEKYHQGRFPIKSSKSQMIWYLSSTPTFHSGTSRPSAPAWFCRCRGRTYVAHVFCILVEQKPKNNLFLFFFFFFGGDAPSSPPSSFSVSSVPLSSSLSSSSEEEEELTSSTSLTSSLGSPAELILSVWTLSCQMWNGWKLDLWICELVFVTVGVPWFVQRWYSIFYTRKYDLQNADEWMQRFIGVKNYQYQSANWSRT